ncbi:MAG: TetR/AcrR family transcriptional regulator [Spirosomataceae bacterium]
MRTRDENKEQIVRQKAIEMIVQEGLDGFSMQKLAKASGVSPATLYIYYKDKDDLILKLGVEEGKRMSDATLQGFNPDLPFAEGLRIQWHNRARFWLENPQANYCFEQLRHSAHRDKIHASIQDNFAEIMGKFVKKAIQNGELSPMPIEVYWSIAFAPLYNLIRFHNEGRSMGGKPFIFSEDIMNQTLALVLKALKP